jgi:hypothetical protein
MVPHQEFMTCKKALYEPLINQGINADYGGSYIRFLDGNKHC